MEKTSSPDRPPLTWQLAAGGQAAIVFSSNLPGNAANDAGKLSTVSMGAQKAEIVTWGDKNDVPMVREEMVCGNNIVPSLISRRQQIILGQGWYAYRERFEDTPTGPMRRIVDEVPLSAPMQDFFDAFEMDAAQIVGDLCKHELSLAEFILTRERRLSSVKALETKYVRAGRKNTAGEIATWWWSNAWTRDQQRLLPGADRRLRDLPVYDSTAQQFRFVVPCFNNLFNDGYYPIPAWWGGRYWIELANAIPIFHLSNLRNMSAPRWLLIIPYDYFRDYQKWNAALDDETRNALLSEEQNKQQAFVDDFNTLVTGMENAGRTLTIQSIQEEILGKVVDKRIQVEPLVIDLRDEALIKLYESSNIANISAQGLHPTLANIETQGRLSSGTEIRNAYLLWLIIAAPAYRKHLYRIVRLAARLLGQPDDVKYAIRDAELTTLAENPAGVQPSENMPPTAA